jgi:3-oxoacyl-[acyl-carrier protein] reductase
MDLGLAGRRAAVAGASSGLGLATARALAAEGVQVAICGRDQGRLDAAAVAARLGMPAVTDEAHGISALGPATQGGGHVLTSAVAPELELPDRDGNLFKLSSLHGRKVLLVAWASW